MKTLIQQIYRHSFFRYLWTGGLGFAIDFGTLNLLHYGIGLHYQVSTAFGFLLGLICVYVICNVWVFSERKWEQSPKKEFAIFAIIGLIGLAFTHLLMWAFVQQVEWSVALSKIITAGIVLLWNYGARKIIIY